MTSVHDDESTFEWPRISHLLIGPNHAGIGGVFLFTEEIYWNYQEARLRHLYQEARLRNKSSAESHFSILIQERKCIAQTSKERLSLLQRRFHYTDCKKY